MVICKFGVSGVVKVKRWREADCGFGFTLPHECGGGDTQSNTDLQAVRLDSPALDWIIVGRIS